MSSRSGGKLLSWVLILAFTCSILAACGKNRAETQKAPGAPTVNASSADQAEKPGSLPIVKSPVTIKIFAGQTGYIKTNNWNEILSWNEMEKRTGIHVEWNIVAGNILAERRNLSFASGDLPDAYMGAGVGTTDVVRLSQEGVFIPLSDLMDQYAPNFKKTMVAYPDIRKGITAPDGKIYTLPKASINLNQSYGRKYWINKKWLDTLGMKMPATTDELYQVFKAFKTKDPNGNGKEDEIPLTASGGGLNDYISVIGGSWGLFNHGTANQYIDMDEKTQKIRFIPLDPRYKEVLQYLNRLYTEKLLDQEYLDNNVTKMTAKNENNLSGCFLFNHPLSAGKYMDNYEGISNPIKGPYGDQLITTVGPMVQVATAFAITKANKYPKETLQWIDYLFGEEGATLFFMGVEGKSYVTNEKGELHYTQEILNSPDMNAALTPYTNWAGSNIPCVRELKYVLDHGDGMPKAVKVTEALTPYFPKEIWNEFWFKEEENSRVVALRNDISKYIGQMQNEFVIGRTSFDKWDEYAATLKKLGVEEYTKLYQASYDRLKAIK